MKVYRLQTYPGTSDWTNEYLPTQTDAKKALEAATTAELPARLDELDVPGGRDGLCMFLNQAVANHMNQYPSRFVARNF